MKSNQTNQGNKTKQVAIISIIALLGVAAGAYILLAEKPVRAEEDHGGGATKEEVVKGPNRGRLLSDPDLQIEMTIFETGVPPIFRAFAYDGKKGIDPNEVTLVVSVHRLGGQVDTVRFKKEADYLTGDKEIGEPHSFTVKVKADWKGKSHAWEYTQLEGRLQLSHEALQSSGVKIVKAGPATVRTVLALNGKIVPNEDKMVQVRARFPGVVKEARKRLGDVVKKGDVLVVVESNESLRSYDVLSQLAGTITEKNAVVGESVTDNQTLYTVADLGSVWVDMNVYRKDFAHLRRGQTVVIKAGDEDETVSTSITYIAPFGSENTQTMVARAVLENRRGEWRPGLFVKAEVTLENVTVPLAVEVEALQTFRDWDVVFIQDGDLFEARPLELGRNDGKWVEVLSGISVGAPYASGNSFLLKAELGKAGATHDH